MTKVNKNSTKKVAAPVVTAATAIQPTIKSGKGKSVNPDKPKTRAKPETTVGRWTMALQIDFSKPKDQTFSKKKRARA